MTRAIFENFRVSDSQRVDFEFTHGDAAVGVFFEASVPLPFDADSIANAVSTLCGSAYDDVTIVLDVSAETATSIRAFTRATVTFASEHRTRANFRRHGHTLSFSGGFDSLAAMHLMPAGTRLVSMDFGGRFARERPIIDHYAETVISTNIVGTELQRNSWSFMGIAAILAAPTHRSRYLTFGSILEAGVDTMRGEPAAARGVTFPPFAAAGYSIAPYVAGVTEIGTANIIAHHAPDTFAQSLPTLALPGEEKLYRKWLLASIALDDAGVQATLDEPEPPRTRTAFGASFTNDFLSLFIAKRAGRDMRDKFVTDVPPEIDALIDRLDLTLYGRINTTLMQHFPSALWGGLMEKAAPAGLIPYTEKDWREYAEIRAALAPFHPTLAG